MPSRVFEDAPNQMVHAMSNSVGYRRPPGYSLEESSGLVVGRDPHLERWLGMSVPVWVGLDMNGILSGNLSATSLIYD